MFALPYEMFYTNTFDVHSMSFPVDLKLPINPMEIASNMESLLSGETFVITLHNDGSFDKTHSTSDYNGIAAKAHALNEARFMSWPIKVEDMENYNEELRDISDALAAGFGAPVSAHLFIGYGGRGSFGWHSDEGIVACYMVSGLKKMETQHGEFILAPGDWLIMNEGVEHCATNLTDSVMLSFGTGNVKTAIKETTMWASASHILE